MEFTWDREKAAANASKHGGALEGEDAPSGMEHREFSIGGEFICGGTCWRCTDIGTRVIVAICLEPSEKVRSWRGDDGEWHQERYIDDDPSWFNGPPYAAPECVFAPFDMGSCTPLPPAKERAAV